MKILFATFAAVFLTTHLAVPMLGAGWYWDTGNAIGFAAFCGLLYLTVTSSRRFDLRAHQALSFGVLIVAIGHAFWFLLGDAAMVEYVKPGAPAYMWSGVASILLFGLLVTVALVPDRMKVHKDYLTFKYWHRVVAAATIATATYHIVVNGFYLATGYQAALIVLLVIAVSMGRSFWVGLGHMPVVTNTAYILVSAVFGGIFVMIRNLPV